MASKDNETPAPIIIKKVKKYAGGHHGGAWKVAYADFVTAMMAFFLLMWLLNVTEKEEKNAISNYFDPTHPRVSSELSGAGGILGGMTVSPEGAMVSNVQDLSPPTEPTTPKSGTSSGKDSDKSNESEFEFDGNLESAEILEEIEKIDAEDIEKMKALVDAVQNEDFEDIKRQIIEEVTKTPELADLKDHLIIDITPEGLRIQIIDKDGRSMFPTGSAEMFDFMRQLVAKVTQIIIPQKNQISVRGHTDSKPYPDGAKYNNWNLSSDRAIASQRAMLESGLNVSRVDNVIGKADREHLLPESPLSERNRRISVILLREELKTSEEIRNAAAQAVKKIADKKEKQKTLEEDRSDKPELDRTVSEKKTNSKITIIDDTQLQKDNSDTKLSEKPIASEIQKLKDQQNNRNETIIIERQKINPAEESGNSTQILEFP